MFVKYPCKPSHTTQYILEICLLTILFCIISLSSGCSYYNRLLTLKDHLYNPDKYIELHDGKQYSLVFKNPVMLKDDIYKLTGIQPASRMKKGDISCWKYIASLLNSTGIIQSEKYNVSAKAFFHDSKLKSILLPRQLSRAISRNLIWKILCTIKNGNINIFRKTFILNFKISNLPKGEILPSIHKVIQLSGPPTIKVDDYHIIYKHRPHEKNVLIGNKNTLVEYWFTKNDKLLKKAVASGNGFRGVIQFISKE